jgi:hypothetical protein
MAISKKLLNGVPFQATLGHFSGHGGAPARQRPWRCYKMVQRVTFFGACDQWHFWHCLFLCQIRPKVPQARLGEREQPSRRTVEQWNRRTFRTELNVLRGIEGTATAAVRQMAQFGSVWLTFFVPWAGETRAMGAKGGAGRAELGGAIRRFSPSSARRLAGAGRSDPR